MSDNSTRTARKSAANHFRKSRPDCYICNEPIDYDAKRDSPESLEVDHVLPKALGGNDTRANLKPAHKRCNQAKGASSITADLTGFFSRGW